MIYFIIICYKKIFSIIQLIFKLKILKNNTKLKNLKLFKLDFLNLDIKF